jgi:hypothetical protein
VPEEPAPAASTRAQEVLIAPATATTPASDSKPAQRAAPSATSSAGALADRCIAPTSDKPPPAVPPGPAPGCPRDPGGAGMLRTVTISAPEATAGPTKLSAEVASAELDRERGLMYRTSMPEDHGMIFDMEQHTIHRFWMRNTCIPLDMLFVDADGMIVGILENVPTLNEDERAVRCPSSYVLEMNAGWARRHGVRAGQRLTLPKL